MNSFVVLIVLVFAAFASATDYCDPKVCTIPPNPVYKHVACGFNGEANKRCTGYIQLTDAQKQLILDTHNKLRNKIASGQQPGFKPAANMATMKWNDELTYIATVNAFNCDFEHDKCRNTDDYKFSGQNLARRGKSDDYPEDNWALEDSINGWYAEVENATQSDIDNFQGGTATRVIGHFTQVVSALTDNLGCAAVKYKYVKNGVEFKAVQLTCNYSRSSLLTQKIYKSGKPGSECKTGTNPQYPALCSESEEYDPNEFIFQ
ncbi:hypothetical protein PVAND_012607 [Polypedilum vanderplanki]|uniref:SCP domain-containing protein n=1 Tax=Polypedilum vanderplanki TaxID=319348 RepID=A0A9J6CM56_POLVA|nr:hypothetical protein PVAND_012607 [Polypedilum vanderplanki]